MHRQLPIKKLQETSICQHTHRYALESRYLYANLLTYMHEWRVGVSRCRSEYPM